VYEGIRQMLARSELGLDDAGRLAPAGSRYTGSQPI
jgi:hypothetical protein